MGSILNLDGGEQAPPPIKDGSTADFMADVIEASREVPIIVDFWATWCGPCKQLSPSLEKVVTEARGAVRLVKIDVDKNPELSAQLRIQSIPTVFAFKDGRPVDAFQGALPESQVKSWVERLVKTFGAEPPPSAVEEAFAAAEAALAGGDHGSAGALFGQVLAKEPDNPKAVAGLARCHLATGEPAKARAFIDDAPDEVKSHPEVEAVRAAIDLAETSAEAVGRTDELRARLARDAGDHAARYDLAMALFGAGESETAVDELLEIVRRDRSWNDEAARKQLLKIFDAMGPADPVTVGGRRKLSAILFS